MVFIATFNNISVTSDTLKSLESENGKMSSSFIHVDMDEKLVQDKDSIENINTECKTNVENDVSHNIGKILSTTCHYALKWFL
jgi:hypothetical protein